MRSHGHPIRCNHFFVEINSNKIDVYLFYLIFDSWWFTCVKTLSTMKLEFFFLLLLNTNMKAIVPTGKRRKLPKYSIVVVKCNTINFKSVYCGLVRFHHYSAHTHRQHICHFDKRISHCTVQNKNTEIGCRRFAQSTTAHCVVCIFVTMYFHMRFAISIVCVCQFVIIVHTAHSADMMTQTEHSRVYLCDTFISIGIVDKAASAYETT